ncbi:unnamed protein product [Phyllotreta striolata]|uniref:protein-histidine N-methyltransferase n=1 Tax=Phyllotreta striolata TaxID=444603 RepID=A0A9N9TZE8_PHYSR|nr:unnamed protein product [Phyllotreta striolata]
MFKFNFLCEKENEHSTEPDLDRQEVFQHSEEICPEPNPQELNDIPKNTIECNDVVINYLCPNSLLDTLKDKKLNESILQAEENHSDLLPAVYEGGLKVWECTYDVLQYFEEAQIDFNNKLVLDLGCGSGILGIYALLKNATCWFQDYNVDVINNITIPNVSLNSEDLMDRSKFFSGDWKYFVDLMKEKYSDRKFDCIITSETIYNTNYYTKLHRVFENLLKKDGVIYLAAKSFYFGVGGGVHLFENYMDNKKVFRHTCCWSTTDGVQRDILKINFL